MIANCGSARSRSGSMGFSKRCSSCTTARHSSSHGHNSGRETVGLAYFLQEAAFLKACVWRELLRGPLRDLASRRPGVLRKLKGALFGLTEAPCYWWLRIQQDLLDVGYVGSPYMPAVFLYELVGRPVGVACRRRSDRRWGPRLRGAHP